jgi:hypothetical protein
MVCTDRTRGGTVCLLLSGSVSVSFPPMNASLSAIHDQDTAAVLFWEEGNFLEHVIESAPMVISHAESKIVKV